MTAPTLAPPTLAPPTPAPPAPAGASDHAVHDALTLRTLEESLRSVLDQEHRVRLTEAVAAVIADGPAALDRRFPAAGREYGRGPLPGWADWSVEDAVRTVLLLALSRRPGGSGEALAREAADRYAHGDAAERRGVLRALPFLPIGDRATHLTDDAVRTNDNRLIAAALGPYAGAHLDQYRWRQAVLKCLFTGIPLAKVAALHERKDAELARMAHGFAAERRAADRAVPADLWAVAGLDH
ncbi:EboA domain-containing protein [Streptomyces sp. RerS4]|uniref:EboA domain-containing protein n=1 Tax=Streptomyces sp. RerS4 TaxID=2942449 RepID=UPI00201C1531|nr:EboA domain-containing protein [Streptomyces sp. RerS4]UQX03494.1 EboA domain-containing protein [Streptomyces sp. RerS4]